MSRIAAQDLKKAIKLFNRWQFEEAIDAFDKMLPLLEGTDKQVIELLSQLSHAFHRVWHKQGEPNAMVSFLQRGSEMMRVVGTNSLGISVNGLQEAIDGCLNEALRWRRGEVEIFNRDLIPRIELIEGYLD